MSRGLGDVYKRQVKSYSKLSLVDSYIICILAMMLASSWELVLKDITPCLARLTNLLENFSIIQEEGLKEAGSKISKFLYSVKNVSIDQHIQESSR